MSFTTIVREWDYYRETEKLWALYSLGDSLVFLSSDSDTQKNSVCGCPFCEVWYEEYCNVSIFVKTIGNFASPGLLTTLSILTYTFEGLSDKESECGNLNIFDLDGWKKIRSLSKTALEQLEWDLFESYRHDLDNFNRVKNWYLTCPLNLTEYSF